jgi:tetratricopeptide (TPR) repeat protein
MADVLAVQQRQDEAITELRAVLKQKPDLPGVHEAIGKNLLQSGKLDESLAEFLAEIQIQPRSASAHMQAGRVLLMSGKNEEAGRMLTKALQFDRPPSAIYFYLGKLDLKRDDFHGAISSLNRYLADAKDDSDASTCC